MNSFSVKKSGKVEFFGITTATPEFLLGHCIHYARTRQDVNLLVQTDPQGESTLFLLDGLAGSLRRVALPAADGTAEGAQKQVQLALSKGRSNGQVGDLVYLAHYEDMDRTPALINLAYDAAKQRDVTHATARWFAQYFVKDALFGFGSDQQFTERGIFRGPDAFISEPVTVKRQLKKLAQAGVLTYETAPKEAGFYFKINHECLPGVRPENLPLFFKALVY